MKRAVPEVETSKPFDRASPSLESGESARIRVRSKVPAFLAARGESDARVFGDFSEFLLGPDASEDRDRSDRDHGFKESLRRRIWRLHLLMRPRRSLERH